MAEQAHIQQPGAAPSGETAQQKLAKIYAREGATSDQTKIGALAHELRLVGGIARTCENVPPEKREEYDRLALEAVCNALWSRPSRP